MIGGKGTVAVDKQETAMKDHQATIKGLGTSMTDLSKSGINMSDGFATLTLSSARVKASQDIVNTSLKENEETLKTLGTENGKLTAENSKYGDSMRKLAAAGKTNSDEFRALNTLVTDNKNKIGANKLEVDGLNKSNTDLNKEGKSLGETFGVLSGKMETATKKGQDKSKMYKDLVDQMAAEASTMGKNTDKYKEMAADLKVMDDNTKSYMDQIGKLTVAEAVAGEMSDQLKKLNDENKTMPWADAFLKANEDIMPVGSNLHTIFDTIFKIIKKVFDLFKSGSENDLGKTTAGAFSYFETLLGKVAKALKFVYDNFDLIITVIKNVVTVLGGLFAVGAAMGTIKKLITVVGLMLNPLNLVIAAVALLSVAWQKNWGGIQEKFGPTVKIIKDKLKEITDWFTGVEPTVKAGLEPAASKFDAFREAIVGMVQKIEAVLIPLKNTFTNAFKGLFSQENIGLDKAQESVQAFLRQIGVVPDEAVKIGFALKGKLAEWKTYFNFPELLAGFDTTNPAFQTLKTDIAGLFKVSFTGEQGEEVVQSFADKVKAGILTVFGDGADATGFAAAIGNLITTAIVEAGKYMDTFKEKLIEMKDKMIEVTKYVWEHREAFFELAKVIAKVLIVLYLFNAANKLFGLTTVVPLAATAVKSLWGMGAALITWASTVATSMGLAGTGATVAAGSFVEGMGTMSIGFGTSLAGVGTMITAFLASLGPVGWAIIAIIAVTIGLLLFNVDGLATHLLATFGNMFATIVKIVSDVLSGIMTTLTDWWENGIKPIWEGSIQPLLQDFAEMWNAVLTAVDFLVEGIDKLWDFLVAVFGPFISWFIQNVLIVLTGAFGGIITVVAGVIRIIWAVIKAIGRSIAQNGLWIKIIGFVKKSWNLMMEVLAGPQADLFWESVYEHMWESLGWLGSLVKGINAVIEALDGLYAAQTLSEQLKATPMYIQTVRGLNVVTEINPIWKDLNKQVADELATQRMFDSFKGTVPDRDEMSELRYKSRTKQNQATTSGFGAWIDALLSGADGDSTADSFLAKFKLSPEGGPTAGQESGAEPIISGYDQYMPGAGITTVVNDRALGAYTRTAREQQAFEDLEKANMYGEYSTAAQYNLKTANYVVYNGAYVSKAMASAMGARQAELDRGYSNALAAIGRGGKAGSLARSQGANIALQKKLAASGMAD